MRKTSQSRGSSHHKPLSWWRSFKATVASVGALAVGLSGMVVAVAPAAQAVPYDEPAIRIVKSVSAAFVLRGDSLTYSLVVTNVGNEDLEDVTVTDDFSQVLPRLAAYPDMAAINAIVVTYTGDVTGSTTLGDLIAGYVLGDLAVGEIVEFEFTVTLANNVVAGTTIVNTAHVTGETDEGDVVYDGDSVTTTVLQEPFASVVATLLTTGTGHGTTAQSFVNTANGFPIGDDNPYNGVVSTGDTARYEVRIVFEPGPARQIDVVVDTPEYLRWLPIGDSFCVNGHFVSARRIGNICRFTVPRGIVETLVVPLLLTASDTHGTVVTNQRLRMGIGLAAGLVYSETITAPVTVVSAPMVDVVLTAPQQFRLNDARTGFVQNVPVRSWSAEGISGHLLAWTLPLRPGNFHPTHGVSTGGPWSGQLVVSEFPACTTWRVNNVDVPVVNGRITFGPVNGNVRFDYTMAEGCIPYLPTGNSLEFQAQVIVAPTSFSADGVLLNNGTGWQPGSGMGATQSTHDPGRGALAGFPYENNDFTSVRLNRPPRFPVTGYIWNAFKRIYGPVSRNHFLHERQNTITGAAPEGWRHHRRHDGFDGGVDAGFSGLGGGQVAPGTELFTHLRVIYRQHMWPAGGGQLIMVDTWDSAQKRFDPRRPITMTTGVVGEDPVPVVGTVWWTDQPRTAQQASNLADPGGWRQGTPNATARAIRIVFAPGVLPPVSLAGENYTRSVDVRLPFVVSDSWVFPGQDGTRIRNTYRAVSRFGHLERYADVFVRLRHPSAVTLWHEPTHLRQLAVPGAVPEPRTQEWFSVNPVPHDTEITYLVTPIVQNLQGARDQITPVVTVELDRCLNTPVNTSAQWNMVLTPAIPGPTGRVCGDPGSTPAVMTFTPNTPNSTITVDRWINEDGTLFWGGLHPLREDEEAWGGRLPLITYTALLSVGTYNHQAVHTHAQFAANIPGTPNTLTTAWMPTQITAGWVTQDAAGITARFPLTEITKDLIWDVSIAAVGEESTDTVIVFPRDGERGSDCELLFEVANYHAFDGPPCSDFTGTFAAMRVIMDEERTSPNVVLQFTTCPYVNFDSSYAGCEAWPWQPVPACGTLPPEATGLRVQMDPVVPEMWSLAQFTVVLQPEGNRPDDVYQMWIGSVRPGGLVPWPDHIEIVASIITGRVWWDENNNSRHLDEDEPGIEGVLVTLHRVNEDGTINPAVYRYTRTDADGYYMFDLLVSGRYVTRVHREADIPVIPETVTSRFGREFAVVMTYSFLNRRFATATEQSTIINLGFDSRQDRVDFGFFKPDPFLKLDKSSATTTCVGGVCEVYWDVTLTNTGNMDLNDVRLYDRLPADAFNIRAYGVDRQPNLCLTSSGLQQCVRAIDVAAGRYFSLVLDEAGNLWTWGRNQQGRLGQGLPESSLDRPWPQQITDAGEPLPRFQSIATSAQAALALDLDGNIWAWGAGQSSVLGLGDSDNRNWPVRITESFAGQPPLPQFVSIDIGSSRAAALDVYGFVWAWGSSTVGDGSTAGRNRPVRITESLAGQPPLPRFEQVSAGHAHIMALDDDGNVWTWGTGTGGPLGHGNTNTQSRPRQVVAAGQPPLPRFVSISAGNQYSLALDQAGNIWAWGNNELGRLGVGDTTNRLWATQLTESLDGAPLPRFVSIEAGNNFAAVNSVSSLAIDADGYVWSWGTAAYGSLGDGLHISAGYRVRPARITESQPGHPPLPRFVRAISGSISSSGHSLALTADGSVWVWGRETFVVSIFGGSQSGTMRTIRPLPTDVFGPRWNVTYGARLPVLETVRTDEHVTSVFGQHVLIGESLTVRVHASFLQPYMSRVVVNQAWASHPYTPVFIRGPLGNEWPPPAVTPTVPNFHAPGVPGNPICDTNAWTTNPPNLQGHPYGESGEPGRLEDICDQTPALLQGSHIPPGALSGVAWYDANWNGIRDPGEVLLPGVRAILMRGNQMMGEQYTGPDGSFLFTGLPPGGDYWVRFVVTHLDVCLALADDPAYCENPANSFAGQSFAFTPYRRVAGVEHEFSASAAAPAPTGESNRYFVVTGQTTQWVNTGVIRVDTSINVTKNLTYFVPRVVDGQDVYVQVDAAGNYVLDGDGNRTYVLVVDGVPVFVNTRPDEPVDPFSVTMVITNDGNEALTNLTWQDTTISGPAMQNINCTFAGAPLTSVPVAGTNRFAFPADFVLPINGTIYCTGVVIGLMPNSTHENVFDVNGEGVISGHPVRDDDDLEVRARSYALHATIVATGNRLISYTWNIVKTATHYCTAGAVQCQNPAYFANTNVWRPIVANTMPVETLVGNDVWFRYTLEVDADEILGGGTAFVDVTLTNESPWPRTLNLTGSNPDATVLVGGIAATPTLVGGQPLVGSTVEVPAVTNGIPGSVTVRFELPKTAAQFDAMPILVTVDADTTGDLWRLDELTTVLFSGNVLLTGDGSHISVVTDTFLEFAGTFSLGERTLNATDPSTSLLWNEFRGTWLFTYHAARGGDLVIPGSEPPAPVVNGTVLTYPNTATVTWYVPNPGFDPGEPECPIDNPPTIPKYDDDDEEVSVTVRDYEVTTPGITVAGTQIYGFEWNIDKRATHYCTAAVAVCGNPANDNNPEIWRPIVASTMPVETLLGQNVLFRYELAVGATQVNHSGTVTVTVPIENTSPVSRTLNVAVPGGDLEVWVGTVRAVPVGVVGSTVTVPAATEAGPGTVTVTFTATKTHAQLSALPINVNTVVNPTVWWLDLLDDITVPMTAADLTRTNDGVSHISVVTDTFPEFAATFTALQRTLNALNPAASEQWNAGLNRWVFRYDAARGGDLYVPGIEPPQPVVNGTVLTYPNTARVDWNIPNPGFDPGQPIGPGNQPTLPRYDEDDETVSVTVNDPALTTEITVAGVQRFGFEWDIVKTATHYCTAAAAVCGNPLNDNNPEIWRPIVASTMPVLTTIGENVLFRYELVVGADRINESGTITVTVPLFNTSPQGRTVSLVGVGADLEVFVGPVRATPLLINGLPLVGTSVYVPGGTAANPGQATVTFVATKTAAQLDNLPIVVFTAVNPAFTWLVPLGTVTDEVNDTNLTRSGDGVSHTSVVTDTFPEFAIAYTLAQRTLNALAPTDSAQWNAGLNRWVFRYDAARGGDLYVPGIEPPQPVVNGTVLTYPNTARVDWNIPNPGFDPMEPPCPIDNPPTLPRYDEDEEIVSVTVNDPALTGNMTVVGAQPERFEWNIVKTATHYCTAGAVQCAADDSLWNEILGDTMPVLTTIGTNVLFRYELAVGATRIGADGTVTITLPISNTSPMARTINLPADLQVLVGGVAATPTLVNGVALVGSTVSVPAGTVAVPGEVTITFAITKTDAQLAASNLPINVTVQVPNVPALAWLAPIGDATGQLTNANLTRTSDVSHISVVTDTFDEFEIAFPNEAQRTLDALNPTASAQWNAERNRWVFTYDAARGGDLTIPGTEPPQPVVNGTVLYYPNTARVTWQVPNPGFDPEQPVGPGNYPTLPEYDEDDEEVSVKVSDYALSLGTLTVTGVQGKRFEWDIVKTATHYCTAAPAVCGNPLNDNDPEIWRPIVASTMPVLTTIGTDVLFRYELGVDATRINEAGTVTVTVPLLNTSTQARTISLEGIGADLEVFVGSSRATPTMVDNVALVGSTVLVPAATDAGPGELTLTFVIPKTAAQLGALPINVTTTVNPELWWLDTLGSATGELTAANLTHTSDGSHISVVTDTFPEFAATFTEAQRTLNALDPNNLLTWCATANLWVLEVEDPDGLLTWNETTGLWTFRYDAARGGDLYIPGTEPPQPVVNGTVLTYPNVARVTWQVPNPGFDPTEPPCPIDNPPTIPQYEEDDEEVSVTVNDPALTGNMTVAGAQRFGFEWDIEKTATHYCTAGAVQCAADDSLWNQIDATTMPVLTTIGTDVLFRYELGVAATRFYEAGTVTVTLPIENTSPIVRIINLPADLQVLVGGVVATPTLVNGVPLVGTTVTVPAGTVADPGEVTITFEIPKTALQLVAANLPINVTVQVPANDPLLAWLTPIGTATGQLTNANLTRSSDGVSHIAEVTDTFDEFADTFTLAQRTLNALDPTNLLTWCATANLWVLEVDDPDGLLTWNETTGLWVFRYDAARGGDLYIPGTEPPQPVVNGTILTYPNTARVTWSIPNPDFDPDEDPCPIDNPPYIEVYEEDEEEVSVKVSDAVFRIVKVGGDPAERTLVGHPVLPENPAHPSWALPGSRFAIHAYVPVDGAQGTIGDLVVECVQGQIPTVPGDVTPRCEVARVLDTSPPAYGWQVTGLMSGTRFWLVETQSPVGHQLLAQPIGFELDALGIPALIHTAGLGASAGIDTSFNDGEDFTYIVVTNVQVIPIPETGGIGEQVVILTGLVILGLGGVLLAGKRMRPRSVYVPRD